MAIEDDIKEKQVLLIILPKEKYSSEVINISNKISNLNNKICYVALNSPYNAIMSNLSNNNIAVDKFFFIDALTSEVQTPEPVENCIFIAAPNALTELSVAISEALNEQKCDNVIIDSLSTLLIYEEDSTIIKFSHNVITKIRVANSKAVFIVLKEDVSSELIKDLYMFVDKVVELS
jgi:archaellum biogenesis ATPase FlaH